MVRHLACLGLLLGAVAAAPAVAQVKAPRSSALPPILVAPARVAMSYGAITSAFRTAAHNRFVGGVPNSYHLYGQALDVARRPGVSHQMVDAALRRAGFRLLESLDEGDHSHFAFALPGAPLALASASPATSRKPAPVAPLPPRLRADEHGTLLVADATLVGPGSRSAPVAAGSQ